MYKLFYTFKKRIACVVLLGQFLLIGMPLGAQSQQEIQSSAPAKQVNLYTDVANLYLKSFNVVETPVTGPSVDEMLKKGQKIKLQKRELSPAQLRHLAFDLLSRRSTHKDAKLEGVLDLSFVKKMELLCGQESSQAHLFSLVNRTKTIVGEAALARMLVTPSADVLELKKRQAIIQELVANQKSFNELDAALELIKKSESQMLGFWQTESQANEYLLRQVYFGSMLLLDKLNNNTAALEIGTRLGNLTGPAKFFELPLIAVFTSELYVLWRTDDVLSHRMSYYAFLTLVLSVIYDGVAQKYNHWKQEENTMAAMIGGAFAGGGTIIGLKAWQAYRILQREFQKNQITNYVQEKMIDVARYVRGMKKSYAIAHANEQLHGIVSLESLAQLKGSSKNSAQFNKLLGMLDHNTFKGKPSFFSITGRALASYKIMQEAKDEFAHAMEAAGELDAYLSMAKLVKEFSHKRVGFSFVCFVEREKPMIQAIDFWNPFISPDVVVVNSLWMGTEQYPNNAVITGPNTGGKSTVVKGVLIALVLAQTFGIAPAAELMITPLVKLNCHLNIADDIAGGISLFKAEVLKAKELINGVEALKPHEFSCTAMDEAFNGTEPKAGAEASYKFSERLASFDNSMVLLATHFPELTKLEDAGKFKNWQVKVIKNDNGSLERPFKLEPGISTLNIALDLLREEGVLL